VGSGGVRGRWHGDVRHARRLVVPGQHGFLRHQPVQDRHRELRAGEQHECSDRPPDEAGHQVRIPAAGHGHHSHVLRLDARRRPGPGEEPENGHRAVL